MENICRTCLKTSKTLVDLKKHESLLEKISQLAAIQVSLKDEVFPHSICNDCEDNLNKFYCFRNIIINADRELRERINNYTNTNLIKEEEICKTEVIFLDENYNDQNDDIFYNGSNHEDSDCSINQNDDIFHDGSNCEDTDCSITTSEKKLSKFSKICTECNMKFSTSAELWKHKRKTHVKPGICNICGVVVRADNLKKHVSIHLQDSVSCKICNKKYKNAESLRSHLLIHKGLEFKCDICGKVSAVKSEHHRHLKSHKDPNIRKVICSVCGKRMRDLKRHMLSHSGERPYPCKHCEKGFTSSYALKVHTRQHTDEKPFICECCSMGFKQKCSLITHLKSKHGIKSK